MLNWTSHQLLSGLSGARAFSIQSHSMPLYEDCWEPLSKVALTFGGQSGLARDDEGVILCMAQGPSSMFRPLMDLSTQARGALGHCPGWYIEQGV